MVMAFSDLEEQATIGEQFNSHDGMGDIHGEKFIKGSQLVLRFMYAHDWTTKTLYMQLQL